MFSLAAVAGGAGRRTLLAGGVLRRLGRVHLLRGRLSTGGGDAGCALLIGRFVRGRPGLVAAGASLNTTLTARLVTCISKVKYP